LSKLIKLTVDGYNELTDRQKEVYNAVEKHGIKKAANILNIKPDSVIRSLYRINAIDTSKTCIEEDVPQDLKIHSGKFKTAFSNKRYNVIITSAQNATPVNTSFWKNLLVLKEHINAQLLVIPFRYKNPTSMFSDKKGEYWDSLLDDYICEDDFDLNKNICILGKLKTQPTAMRPLSGLEQVSGEKSAIIGHAKLALSSIATPSNTLPKLLISTGCCTAPNYTDSKAGYKGEKRHSLSAIIVEVNGDLFFTREVIGCEDGSFIDLNTEYRNGTCYTAPRASVLSTGDLHGINSDAKACNATFFAPDSMLKFFKPRYMTLDDTLDFQAASHHNRKDPVLMHQLAISGSTDILTELKNTFSLIDQMHTEDTTIVIKRSNHDEHFERWVKDTDPRTDPLNAATWCKSFLAMTNNENPYKYFAKEMMRTYDNVVFLERDAAFVVDGVSHDGHGDLGLNGARGSLISFTKLGCPGQWGHSHSAGIADDQYQNGTNSKLRLGYNRGPSSWTHSNTIQYANGKRSLLFVINGKWRFDN